jgi:hypothetical protein
VLGYFWRRTHRAELAADLAGEVFAAALESASRFNPKLGTARVWLFGIARHELADALDRARVEDAARRRLGIPPLVRDPRRGGVLGSYYLDDAVPAETGRRTLAGDDRWSGPGYTYDVKMASAILHGWLTGSRARTFVLASGARFVLAGCGLVQPCT